MDALLDAGLAIWSAAALFAFALAAHLFLMNLVCGLRGVPVPRWMGWSQLRLWPDQEEIEVGGVSLRQWRLHQDHLDGWAALAGSGIEPSNSPVAQQAERPAVNREVAGSKPAGGATVRIQGTSRSRKREREEQVLALVDADEDLTNLVWSHAAQGYVSATAALVRRAAVERSGGQWT